MSVVKTRFLRVPCPIDETDALIMGEMLRYSNGRVIDRIIGETDNWHVIEHSNVVWCQMCRRRWQSFGVRAVLCRADGNSGTKNNPNYG